METATLKDGRTIQFKPDKIGDGAMKEVYFTHDMMNHHASSVLVGDYLYGFSNSILTAMRFADGKVAWQKRFPAIRAD